MPLFRWSGANRKWGEPAVRNRLINVAAQWAKRPSGLLILLALTLSLSLVVYASVTQELGSAVLLSTLITIAIFIVWLLLRLQKVEVERDRALAWSREAEWRASQQQLFQISQTGPESAMHLQQLLDLQKEIAALRAREVVLEKQAYYDELTKLPNRALLRLRFRSAIERSMRNNLPFAVLMLDLNGFKAVNDQYGHEIGDFVLVTTANRISGTLRPTDTAARLGGDEFVLVIESTTTSEDFEQISQKLLDTLFEPIRLPDGKTIDVGASLGKSIYPRDGSDLSALLAVADRAMYQSKATGLARLD